MTSRIISLALIAVLATANTFIGIKIGNNIKELKSNKVDNVNIGNRDEIISNVMEYCLASDIQEYIYDESKLNRISKNLKDRLVLKYDTEDEPKCGGCEEYEENGYCEHGVISGKGRLKEIYNEIQDNEIECRGNKVSLKDISYENYSSNLYENVDSNINQYMLSRKYYNVKYEPMVANVYIDKNTKEVVKIDYSTSDKVEIKSTVMNAGVEQKKDKDKNEYIPMTTPNPDEFKENEIVLNEE